MQTKRLVTAYAPAERAGQEQVADAVQRLARHPLLRALLDTVDGLLMVLNRHHQVIAVNDEVLGRLGYSVGAESLGLRPGEILSCVHASERSGGCGTTPACASCGATVSIIESHEQSRPVSAPCYLTVQRGEVTEALELEARASPFSLEGEQLTLLSLRDVSNLRRREQLERVFLHDIAGTVSALQGWAELLVDLPPDEAGDAAGKVLRMAVKLRDEVASQRDLRRAERGDLKLELVELSISEVVAEVRALFEGHPVARDRQLSIPQESDIDDLCVRTDRVLLLRVLFNMLKNAFEAIEPGQEVRFSWCGDGDRLAFEVWNPGHIPEKAKQHVFQRSFSTKGQIGRGLGTYSMKLLGERYLGGRVGFETGEESGTRFYIELPSGSETRTSDPPPQFDPPPEEASFRATDR
ncbi:MAG: HAMP domain-containing sensor histidine kinase [Polyangia bacterium]